MNTLKVYTKAECEDYHIAGPVAECGAEKSVVVELGGYVVRLRHSTKLGKVCVGVSKENNGGWLGGVSEQWFDVEGGKESVLTQKVHLLEKHGFKYDFMTISYVNKAKKMIFSDEYLRKMSVEELERVLGEGGEIWRFFYLGDISEMVRDTIVERYSNKA